MPSQLLKNDNISFVVAKPFTSRGKTYTVGEDFPQEEARDIETFVRARFIIPVVEDIADKTHIRHWHHHIRPREEVIERLLGDRTQLVMPTPPDSDEQVNLEVLTHPELTPEPDAESSSSDEPEIIEEETDSASDTAFDPSEHTVNEVLAYLSTAGDEEYERVMQAERDDRGRKGILEA